MTSDTRKPTETLLGTNVSIHLSEGTKLREQFEAMVTALAKPGQAILREVTADQMHALHMAVGASGEAGELLDAIKKWVIYQKPLDTVNVIEELGDLEFYLQGLREGLGITREQTIAANVAKLGKRYHTGGYTNAQAQQRADKPAGE